MLIRQLVVRLHYLIINRRRAPRFEIRIPITIIIPTEKNLNANLLNREILSMTGETKDLSEAGLGFFVSSIRLREHYLVSEERPLIAELNLPEGQIKMKIVGVRYERENGNSAGLKYLVGARISNMMPAEKEIYQRFLRNENSWKKDGIQDFSTEIPES